MAEGMAHGDVYASKAYPGNPRSAESDVMRSGEINVLVSALKSTLSDIEKSFLIHTERLSPIRGPRPTEASEYPADKRGCSTQLGEELGSILDRLQSHRKHIENATNELEI